MNISGLITRYMGQVVEYHMEIDSTNIRAKKWAREGAIEGSLVIAEYQSAGKGRLGRSWVSPKYTGIWMSVVLKPQMKAHKIPQLTLIAGFCMCKAIRNVTSLDAEIKWPNDIIVNGKKVCGILTEMSVDTEQVRYVVVGIGVNVNDKEFDEAIPYATSLALQGGQNYTREVIISEFLKLFEIYYEKYKEQNSLKFFIEEYKNWCVNLNKEVKILRDQKEYIVYAKEIDEEGSLVIEHQEGQQEIIFTGEVSVRGLYGYV